MDLGISDGGGFAGDNQQQHQDEKPLTPKLPLDLPKSLDDRRRQPLELPPETELYDGWQGKLKVPCCSSSVLFMCLLCLFCAT